MLRSGDPPPIAEYPSALLGALTVDRAKARRGWRILAAPGKLQARGVGGGRVGTSSVTDTYRTPMQACEKKLHLIQLTEL